MIWTRVLNELRVQLEATNVWSLEAQLHVAQCYLDVRERNSHCQDRSNTHHSMRSRLLLGSRPCRSSPATSTPPIPPRA
jgi:hypothetical protein